jgi:hypothetical protein
MVDIWLMISSLDAFKISAHDYLLGLSVMSSSKQQNIIVAGTIQGDTTIDVHKLLSKKWYQYPHLRRLYGWMSVVLLVQATNGLDGSIMNGMQTLTYWTKYVDVFLIITRLR